MHVSFLYNVDPMKKFFLLSQLRNYFQCIIQIKYSDRKKVMGLLLLRFFLAFVYCILSGIKDTLLVTAKYATAEVIPIVKGCIIFPISIIIVLVYNKLDNHFKQSTIYYSTIYFFLFVILLYGFVLYPNEEKISPNTMSDLLVRYTNGKHLHWIAVFRHWIHVLFFITAELWGQVVLMVLYWSFANNICKIDDAKRFYGMLIAGGDLPLLITSPLIRMYTKKYEKISFLLTVQSLIGYVTILCLAAVITYWWMMYAMKKHFPTINNTIFTSKKNQLSMRDSFMHIISSKYLIQIFIMVIACGFSVNIVEATWKSYIKEAFPKSSDYQNFSSLITFWSGIFALICSLFFSGRFLRKFGWKTTAKVAPITIGTMGGMFLLMSYARNNIPFLQDFIGSNFITYIAIFGGIQNLFTKVMKYVFFDKIIQIAYIPLDPKIKVKGKTAIDILGSNLGKAGSSWIQIGLLGLLNTNGLQSISLILFAFLLVIITFWYRAINSIGKQLL